METFVVYISPFCYYMMLCFEKPESDYWNTILMALHFRVRLYLPFAFTCGDQWHAGGFRWQILEQWRGKKKKPSLVSSPLLSH